jgi:hypothetical protein
MVSVVTMKLEAFALTAAVRRTAAPRIRTRVMMESVV